MTPLLLHPKTKLQYEMICERMPHAVLMAGTEGSGKETLALQLAAKLLQTPGEKLHNYAYFLRINPVGESISINEIRELQQFLKLRVPKEEAGMSRIVLIDRAERMRTEAQNALLKTLEEPPVDTCIILTTNSTDLLLPTISSRTQELIVLPVSNAAALDYFSDLGKSRSEINKYYALSQGQAGLLSALLFDQDHPLVRQVDLAKQLLSEPAAKRLLRTDELAKDKQQVKLLLNALGRIAHAALANSAKQNSDSAVKQWHTRQTVIIEAGTKFVYNPNIKLLLDDLFLAI